MNKLTYLAGPINGCTDDEAINWREVVKRRLGAENCLDPMQRDYRGREDEYVAEIVNGDKADIEKCGVFLANCWQVSVGTSMEILYAHDYTLAFIIVVVRPGAKVSPWIRHHADAIFTSLNAALEAIVRL